MAPKNCNSPEVASAARCWIERADASLARRASVKERMTRQYKIFSSSVKHALARFVNQVAVPQIFVEGEEYNRAAALEKSQWVAEGAAGRRPRCQRNLAVDKRVLTVL